MELGSREFARLLRYELIGLCSVILLDSAKQFGQSVAMDYPPQGLRYDLALQLIAIEASKAFTKPESGTMLSPARAAPV